MPGNSGDVAPDSTTDRPRKTAVSIMTAIACLLPTGCTVGRPPAVAPSTDFTGPAYTMRVLASGELADLGPVLADAAKATGVTVTLTPSTSLAGSRAVAHGDLADKYDATWFATNRYLTMLPGAFAKLDGTTKTMSSPVVLGVRASVAHRLGWDTAPVTWSGVVAAVSAHQFNYGMSDPSDSNSALSALVGVATAVAGHGGALQPAAVSTAEPQLRKFFGGQSLKSPTSADLADDYVRTQGGNAQGGRVDGLVDYESLLLSMNSSGRLKEPLTLVYPSDGTVTADYTLSLLASAPKPAKDAYRRLVAYLRTPQVQGRVMTQTRRRPVVPEVEPDAELRQHSTYELPFPGSIDVVDDLINAYYGKLRRPARMVYVLDTSGSMADHGRLTQLKAGLDRLTGASGSMGSVIRTRDQVTMLPFSSAPGAPAFFNIPVRDPQTSLRKIQAFTAGLSAKGGTAVYDAVERAYQICAEQAATDPNRITTIVLLSDGESNVGATPPEFEMFYRRLPSRIASVPVLPILFGNAADKQMRWLAQLTAGRVFDGRRLPLATVFSLIRGSQ